MWDYYDPSPRTVLPRPLALVGHAGNRSADIAGALTLTTGIPLADLHRWVEHERGCSVAAYVVQEGRRALVDDEARMVQRALQGTPPPVMLLSDLALTRSRTVRALSAKADVVWLRRSLASTHQALQQLHARTPDQLPDFVFGVPDDVDDLETLWLEREPSLRHAHHVIDVDDVPTTKIVQQLLRLAGL